MGRGWAGAALACTAACSGTLPLVGADSGTTLDAAVTMEAGGETGAVDSGPAGDSGSIGPDADVADVSPWDAPIDVGPPPPPPLWWEQVPAPSSGSLVGVAVDSSQDVLVGGGSGFVVEEYDSIGNPIWKSPAWGMNLQFLAATAVAFDHVGAMYAAGQVSGSGTLNLGGADLVGSGSFLVKYDASGTFQWQVGPFASAAFKSLAVTSANHLVACGWLDGTQDFGGGPIASAGGYDALLVDFDSNGSFVRNRVYGDSDTQAIKACVVNASDDIVLTGEFGGSIDFGGGPLVGPTGEGLGAGNVFVAELDSAANYLQAIDLKTKASAAGGVATDGSGNVFVTGSTPVGVDLGGGMLSTSSYSVFWGKLTSSLGYLWGKVNGTNVMAGSVAVDPSGDPAFIGNFTGDVDFGCGTLSTKNGQCGYVTKTDPSGNCIATGAAQGSSCNVQLQGIAFLEQQDWAIVGSGGGKFAGLPPVGGGFVIRWAP